MALSQEQIFGLELFYRAKAHGIRESIAAHPGTTDAMKLVDEFRRAEAARFDLTGALLLGFRGLDESEFAQVMGMLRIGHKRLDGKKYDESKTYTLAVTADVPVETEAAEPTEVAA